MERSKALVVTACLAVLFTACEQLTPAGSEPSAPTAGEPVAAVGEAAAIEEPEPEPLSLRFVTPNRGPAAGGNEVVVDGQGFGSYPRVHFGGVPAWIVAVTPAEIRVTVPPPAAPVAAGETRVVDVTVTNPPAASAPPVSAILTQAYFYVAAAGTSIAEVPASGTGTASPPTASPPTAAPPTAAQPAAPPPVATAAVAERAPEGPALVARFRFETVAEASEGCAAGHGIRFTDRSTGGASGWLWEFGDGEGSSEQHPAHCYETPGLRSVSLTVSNDRQSSTFSDIVIVGME